MVYCAEEATGALLEALVHLEVESLEGLPRSYQLMRIALPAKIATEEVELSSLPGLEAPDTPDAQHRRRLAGRGAHARAARSKRRLAARFQHAAQACARKGAGIRVVSRSRHPFDNRLFRAMGASAPGARRRGGSGER